MNLFLLYAEFFKIGLFSIGGGLATLPFLYNMAARYDWLNPEDIGNFLAIGQSVPGAIGVNICTQTGYLGGGLPGLFLAPLGLICPAIIVIVLTARFLAAFKENAAIKAIFNGLRPAASGLIAAAGFAVIIVSFYSIHLFSFVAWYKGLLWKETLLFIAFSFAVLKFKQHPIVYIAAAGAAGIILKL